MTPKKFYTVPFVWNKTLWVMTFLVFILWAGYSAWNLWEIFTTDNNAGAVVALIVFNLTMLPTVLSARVWRHNDWRLARSNSLYFAAIRVSQSMPTR